jgi:O-antigen biosynthesis protein
MTESRTEPEAIDARVRELRAELRRREAEVDALESIVASQRHALANIQGSFAWQLIRRLRHARDRVVARSALARLGHARASAALDRILGRPPPGPPPSRGADAAAYARWMARHALSAAALEQLRVKASRLPTRPSFSIVVSAREARDAELRRCVASVRKQVWDRWELVALCDGSEPAPVARVLTEAAAGPGVRVERVAAGAAAGAVLAAARSEFLAFVGAADALAPEALYEVALAIEATPDADILYSDEDAIDEDGRRAAPFFKPDWSPDLLLSMDYVGQLAVFRRGLLEQVVESAPDADRHYDLTLRAAEVARNIVHIPAVLYHAARARRADVAAPALDVLDGERLALEEAVRRRRLDARVEHTARPGVFRVRYAVAGAPLVSIVMPTKDKVEVLRTCLESIEARSTWRNRELLLVDNGSAERKALRYLRELERRHRVLRDARKFNWSSINNAAACAARGDYLLFMNNDR